jgi:CubicO group peptidase (beta-lactamase class C family)
MDLYEKQLAVGYGALKRDGTRDVVNPFRVEGMAAAAGLTSNVEDLARFISWNFHLLRSGGTDIVRASTLRDMQRVHWTDMDGKTTWGLGFAVRYEGGKNIVSHAGWCPGYRTGIRMQPDEDLGIIVLTNVPNNLAKYTNGIAKILAKAKKIETTKAGEAVTIFEEYAGRYNSQPWSTELVVLPWGTHLAAFTIPIDDFDAEMGILKPTGKDTFRRVNDDNTLGAETRFERGANGRVTRIVTNSQFSERLD